MWDILQIEKSFLLLRTAKRRGKLYTTLKNAEITEKNVENIQSIIMESAVK